MTIKKYLEDYLFDESDNILSNPGGRFTTRDFQLLYNLLNEKEGNYIIFENAGGKPFDVWLVNEKYNFEETVKSLQPYVLATKNGKKEKIYKQLPKY